MLRALVLCMLFECCSPLQCTLGLFQGALMFLSLSLPAYAGYRTSLVHTKPETPNQSYRPHPFLQTKLGTNSCMPFSRLCTYACSWLDCMTPPCGFTAHAAGCLCPFRFRHNGSLRHRDLHVSNDLWPAALSPDLASGLS